MKCPLCFQPMHSAAKRCPHCDAEATQLNELYEEFPSSIRLLNDQAGVLKIPQKRRIEKWIQQFNKEFPGCYLTIHIVGLNDHQSAKSYGIWALNTPDYRDFPKSARHDAGLSLVLDVRNKQVCLNYGYQLEPYLTPNLCFDALSTAHPYLLDSSYFDAIQMMRHGIRSKLRWKSRFAKSTLKKKNLLNRIVSK